MKAPVYSVWRIWKIDYFTSGTAQSDLLSEDGGPHYTGLLWIRAPPPIFPLHLESLFSLSSQRACFLSLWFQVEVQQVATSATTRDRGWGNYIQTFPGVSVNVCGFIIISSMINGAILRLLQREVSPHQPSLTSIEVWGQQGVWRRRDQAFQGSVGWSWGTWVGSRRWGCDQQFCPISWAVWNSIWLFTSAWICTTSIGGTVLGRPIGQW